MILGVPNNNPMFLPVGRVCRACSGECQERGKTPVLKVTEGRGKVSHFLGQKGELARQRELYIHLKGGKWIVKTEIYHG